ncbi:MAG: right-handed parallel beta-helix repeat-containing protein, partial [Spirochaetales bacterium]|nr:right-handed parallel beta-helix repeat-containing protein [Spirochaetales bacterium]
MRHKLKSLLLLVMVTILGCDIFDNNLDIEFKAGEDNGSFSIGDKSFHVIKVEDTFEKSTSQKIITITNPSSSHLQLDNFVCVGEGFSVELVTPDGFDKKSQVLVLKGSNDDSDIPQGYFVDSVSYNIIFKPAENLSYNANFKIFTKNSKNPVISFVLVGEGKKQKNKLTLELDENFHYIVKQNVAWEEVKDYFSSAIVSCRDRNNKNIIDFVEVSVEDFDSSQDIGEKAGVVTYSVKYDGESVSFSKDIIITALLPPVITPDQESGAIFDGVSYVADPKFNFDYQLDSSMPESYIVSVELSLYKKGDPTPINTQNSDNPVHEYQVPESYLLSSDEYTLELIYTLTDGTKSPTARYSFEILPRLYVSSKDGDLEELKGSKCNPFKPVEISAFKFPLGFEIIVLELVDGDNLSLGYNYGNEQRLIVKGEVSTVIKSKILVSSSSNITFDNLNFQGDGAGIEFLLSDNVVISNSLFKKNNMSIVLRGDISGCNNFIIENNLFSSNTTVGELKYSSNIYFQNNLMEANKSLIEIIESSKIYFRYNFSHNDVIDSNSYFHFPSSISELNTLFVYNNTIYNSGNFQDKNFFINLAGSAPVSAILVFNNLFLSANLPGNDHSFKLSSRSEVMFENNYIDW